MKTLLFTALLLTACNLTPIAPEGTPASTSTTIPKPFVTVTSGPDMARVPTPTDVPNVPHEEIVVIDGQEVKVSWNAALEFRLNCVPREALNLFDKAVAAFNRGDQAQLAMLFLESEIPGMSPSQWFAVSEGDSNRGGRHFVAYELKDLLPYFAKRFEQHERLILRELNLTPSWSGTDFDFSLFRHADDIKPTPKNPENIAEGKGSINCEKRRFRVWAMGMTR